MNKITRILMVFLFFIIFLCSIVGIKSKPVNEEDINTSATTTETTPSLESTTTSTTATSTTKESTTTTSKTTLETSLQTTSTSESKPQANRAQFNLTAYCKGACCCGKWAGSPTASGTWPEQGRTIAVYPAQIPYGTEVTIEGLGTYIAEDCGGNIGYNCIDIYMDSHSAAQEFGVKYAMVSW